MKKLKTIFTLILTFTLVLSLGSCGESSGKDTSNSSSSAVYRTLDEIKKSGKLSKAALGRTETAHGNCQSLVYTSRYLVV